MRRLVPVRYPVPASADHAVEGAAGGGEAGLELAAMIASIERIDCRIRHAGKVVLSPGRRRLRGKCERSESPGSRKS